MSEKAGSAQGQLSPLLSCETRIPLSAGESELTEQPGLGLTLSEAALKKFGEKIL